MYTYNEDGELTAVVRSGDLVLRGSRDVCVIDTSLRNPALCLGRFSRLLLTRLGHRNRVEHLFYGIDNRLRFLDLNIMPRILDQDEFALGRQ